MSTVPGTQADAFSARLQDALKQAQTGATKPAGAASVAAPAGGVPTDFSQRLSAALKKATGTEAAQAEEARQPEPGGPVGAGDYVVRDGDCISSIAKQHGLFWETLWTHADNTPVRDTRKDPNVLLPGDRLTVPDPRRKDEDIAPEKRHRFKRRGEPSRLLLRVLDEGEPVANAPYELEVDGKLAAEGVTDADGNVRLPIPGNARRARLTVGEEDDQRVYELKLGQLSPISEVVGVQERLCGLGYEIEHEDGELDEVTRAAISAFQKNQGLPESGEPDAETRDRLTQVFGC